MLATAPLRRHWVSGTRSLGHQKARLSKVACEKELEPWQSKQNRPFLACSDSSSTIAGDRIEKLLDDTYQPKPQPPVPASLLAAVGQSHVHGGTQRGVSRGSLGGYEKGRESPFFAPRTTTYQLAGGPASGMGDIEGGMNSLQYSFTRVSTAAGRGMPRIGSQMARVSMSDASTNLPR